MRRSPSLQQRVPRLATERHALRPGRVATISASPRCASKVSPKAARWRSQFGLACRPSAADWGPKAYDSRVPRRRLAQRIKCCGLLGGRPRELGLKPLGSVASVPCNPNDTVPVPTLIDRVFDRVDQIQRRYRLLSFPHAVFKRYGEDHGGWLGALISYYGFFSLFPLLVVFVTVATWALGSRPDLLHTVLQAVWSNVPFAASVLQQNVEQEVGKLEGNTWVAVASLLVMLWGGVGVVRVLQDGVNTVWGVARYRRPGFFPKIARSAAILGLLGLGLVASGVVAGLTVTVEFPVAGLVLVAVVTVGLTSAITVVVYHLSIAAPVSNAEVAPGAIMMGLGTYGLTLIAGIYVQRVIARASGIYGPFATTIGLLAYVSLVVQLFVVATEVNVVRSKTLWPRSLTGRALGEPDARAIDLTLQRERLLSRQQLTERGLPEAEIDAIGAEPPESRTSRHISDEDPLDNGRAT